MTVRLSDRWSAWWVEHAREGRASNTSLGISAVPITVVDRAVRKALTDDGLSFPSRRFLEQRLTMDLEPHPDT